MDQDSIDAITDAIMIEVQTAGVRDQLKRVSDKVSDSVAKAKDAANKVREKAQQLIEDAKKAANHTHPHTRTLIDDARKAANHTRVEKENLLAKQNLEKLGRRFYALQETDQMVHIEDMDAWVKDLQSMSTVLVDIQGRYDNIAMKRGDMQDKILDLMKEIKLMSNDRLVVGGTRLRDKEIKGAKMQDWYGKILRLSYMINAYNQRVSDIMI
jgi:F0F1-type ATP synthase membrane subunit b/b'